MSEPSFHRGEADTIVGSLFFPFFPMLKHNLKCVWKVCFHRNHIAEMSRKSEVLGGEKHLMKGGKH